MPSPSTFYARLRPPIEARSGVTGVGPGRRNDLLAWVFAAEAPIVSRVDVPFGVSLFAIARRRAGA